jgi:flagellar basal-body rod protein FlgF
MDRGIYVVASSGLTNLRKLEVVNNNLANVNTPGFKRQVIVTDELQFEDTFAKEFAKSDPYAKGDHERTPGVKNIRAVTDFTPGAIKHTGNPLNVALTGQNQFFAVQTPDGIQYTRAGTFTLNDQGTLVTDDGMPVLGGGGPVQTEGPGIRINQNGTVLSGSIVQGDIQVVEFANPQALERVGANRFKATSAAGAPTQVEAKLAENSLEMANVSAVSSMVEMITANRGFEMYTRTAQSIDQLNQSAITQIGRSR